MESASIESTHNVVNTASTAVTRWRAVAAAFVTMAHGPGIHYCYGIFQAELVARRALATSSHAIVGGAGSLSTALMELGAYGSGALQERIGARDTVRLGGLLAACGLASCAACSQAWQLYLSFGVVVGLAHSLTFPPCPVAVAMYFDGMPKAALASGVSTAGSGAGAIAGAVAIRAIIAVTDWRIAFLALAASTLVCVEGAAPALGRRLPSSSTSFSLALESSPRGPLRKLAVCAAAYGLGWEIPFVHAVSYARDSGYSRSAAAAIVVFVGLGGALGRISWLAAADFVGPPAALVGACAATTLANLCLPLVIASSPALYTYAFVVGSTAGACIGLNTPLAKVCLQADASIGIPLTKASGLTYSVMAPGLLLGPIVAGIIRDTTHAFDTAFIFAGACWFIALLCAIDLRRSLYRYGHCRAGDRTPVCPPTRLPAKDAASDGKEAVPDISP